MVTMLISTRKLENYTDCVVGSHAVQIETVENREELICNSSSLTLLFLTGKILRIVVICGPGDHVFIDGRIEEAPPCLFDDQVTLKIHVSQCLNH